MKKLGLLISFLLLVPFIAFGQIINNFDIASPDTNYWAFFVNHGGQHYQTSGAADSAKGWLMVSHVTDPVYKGVGAMKLEYSVHNIEGWGGFTKLEHWHPDSMGVYDWSGYDSVAFWYYNAVPQTLPGRVELRFNLHDVSNSPNGPNTAIVADCEYYYSFEKVLDSNVGWNKFQLPLVNNTNAWNGEAFNRTGWSGIVGNNELDTDQIKGFSIEFSISGGGEGDFSTGTIILDHLTLIGRKHRNFVFFNGRDLPTVLSSWAWGQSSIEVAEEAGPIPGTNALKWVQGDEWGGGWTGMGFSINPPYNMDFEWPSDTLKFKLKAEAGVGPLRVQFEGGGGKIGTVFTPVADNEWHNYAFKLSEMVYLDNTSNFTFEAVGVLGMMAEASGVAGKVIYITDWWTGNPVIDVVVPKAPTSIAGVPGQYYNLVIWEDVKGESQEVYSVYTSEEPITDLTAAGVELVASGVIEDQQSVAHFINFPLTDHEMTYYYAVVCKDASGNVGPYATSGAVVNTAKGIPTISLTPPPNFVADGDVSEWEAMNIMPFILKPSESHWSLGTFDGDNDLNATCYIAVDQDYFYMAVDVIDDVYSYDPAGNFYEDDVIEFYIGLYNTTKRHNSFKRGAEPDYKFIILSTDLIHEPGYLTLYPNDSPNYKYVNFGASDWAVEMKVPLDSLLVGSAKDDQRFTPLNGMKITMDINIHDSDNPNVREGILSFSETANDNSWIGPQNWGITWIGDTNKISAVEDAENTPVVNGFQLAQNYPNPFNAATTINYMLAKPGMVKIELYNTLGQRVRTLVNEFKASGSHSLKINFDNLNTGIYFYKIETSDFSQTAKMVLMK
jgi:hypothetical protein